MIESSIKQIRLLKQVNQEELSKRTGYTQGYISLIETGRRLPSDENIQVIANALGCSFGELCGEQRKEVLLSNLKNEIENLSELEIEKTLDYVLTLKRGRR